MQNLLKNLPENIKRAVSAGAPLLIVIVLFVIVGKFGVPKVLELRSEVKAAQKTEEKLTQKLNLLQTLSSDVALKANIVSSALPDSNPALAVMSQLKNLALNQGVVLSVMKSSAGTGNSAGLNEVNISFTLDGARPQINSYLAEIAKIAPITTVRKIAIIESAGGTSADIGVVTYWAEFPKTIPAVTEAITDFTSEDKKILSNISALIQPSSMEVAPFGGEINPNPFGQ